VEPIIVIVGFLGAGKTTLLKRLIKDYKDQEWNPYFILNDYENANLDSQQFLSFLSPEQINSLKGSCICCSGVTELRQAVNSIPRREKGITFIEANGTTDACTLMGFLGVGINENFAPPVQVSVVDTRNWQNRGINNELEASQIQVSSLIVLNYANQIERERLDKIKAQIFDLNPSAIIKTWEELDSLSLKELAPSKNQSKAIDHFKSHWSSCSVDLPNPLSSKTLSSILDGVPDTILRVKGCTKLDEDDYYSYFEMTPTRETFVRPYTGNLVSGPKLLVIGPGSNPDNLTNLINKEISHA
jgi:G3E family GTPase